MEVRVIQVDFVEIENIGVVQLQQNVQFILNQIDFRVYALSGNLLYRKALLFLLVTPSVSQFYHSEVTWA